jgi:hypothetical protein
VLNETRLFILQNGNKWGNSIDEVKNVEVSSQLSAVSSQLSAVSFQRSAVSYQQSAVSGQQSAIREKDRL